MVTESNELAFSFRTKKLADIDIPEYSKKNRNVWERERGDVEAEKVGRFYPLAIIIVHISLKPAAKLD